MSTRKAAGRDESGWVNFDLTVSISVSPELAERFRVYLFGELCSIEFNDAAVLALENDLPGLWARALDRQQSPFAAIYEVSGDDLLEDYYWFGEAVRPEPEEDGPGKIDCERCGKELTQGDSGNDYVVLGPEGGVFCQSCAQLVAAQIDSL